MYLFFVPFILYGIFSSYTYYHHALFDRTFCHHPDSAGKFGETDATTSLPACSDCGTGQYQNEVSTTACKDCDPGKGSGAGAAVCQPCPAGQAGTPCNPCLAGTYRPSNDENGNPTSALSCLPCGLGRYQDQTGQAACLPCIPGEYQHQEGQTVRSQPLLVTCTCSVLLSNLTFH